MLKILIYVVAGIAVLAWTAFLAITLEVLTYVLCYWKSANCAPGVMARVAAVFVYFLVLALGYVLVRWALQAIARRAAAPPQKRS